MTAAAALALASGPVLAQNGNNGESGAQSGVHGKGASAPWGGGGGTQYSTVDREPSHQQTGSVAGNTGVGVCGCH